MANYPPPPPGGYGPPGGPPGPGWGAPDPYAQDRALAGWAAERQYELVPQGDPGFYYGWYPFTYLERPTSFTRELRLPVDDGRMFVTEAWSNDPLRQAFGNGSRMILFFLMSQRLRYRVSLRSKQGDGIDKEFGRELANLFGGAKPPGSFLGDPTLEQRFEVSAPTPQEGNWALPMPLRQILVQPSFRGVLELRPQGMAATLFDYHSFDPRTLDAGIQMVTALFRAAAPPASETPPA